MLKEIKYLILTVIVCLFLILTGRYYFSDANKKKSYRSFSSIDEKIYLFTQNLPVIDGDTKDIIEYVEQSTDKKKKKFSFWKLLETNE